MRGWLVGVALALWPALSAGGNRIALLASSDVGLVNETPLRFSAGDAERMASVLIELGGFDRADVQVMAGANAAQVLAALEQLAKRPQRAELFVFYFSGHADAAALHPAGTLLPVDELLERTKAISAQLSLGIIDACQSGGATRAKGVRAAPAFEVRFAAPQAQGQILISSSAADEQSYEADAQRGALFTLNWTTGLRGAADRNGDARVTLSEAYAYAYSQTLRATLLSTGGPQHPTFKWDFSGQQDPVLTQLGRSAQVTLVADEENGTYLVFDGNERELLAELPARSHERTRLALAPGEYLINKRGRRDVRSARVALGPHDDRLLYDYQMKSVPLVRLARKGALSNLWVTAGAGQLATRLGAGGAFAGTIGVEWQHERWRFGAQLFVASGSEVNGVVQGDLSAQLISHTLFIGPKLFALYGWHWSPVSIGLGPLLAPIVVSQRIEAQPGRLGFAGVVGARLQLVVVLTAHVAIALNGDVGVAFAKASGPSQPWLWPLGNEVLATAWGAWSAGARFAW